MQRRPLLSRSPLRRPIVGVAVAFLALVAAGCSDAGGGGDGAIDATESTTASSLTPTTSPADGPDTTAVSSESVATTENAALEGTATTETIATVPEQVAPGIDSADPFCRSWSEFAGSFQALAFASAAGPDPATAPRLEVIAAGAVVRAVQTLADEFPESIATEQRDVFLDDVIGPFARRAGRATDELGNAGLSPAQIEQLGDAWLAALVAADVDDPNVEVAVPSDLSGAVDAATSAFSADVPSIAADPSLVTSAESPATFDYLAENCPDQGILGGIDAVD